MPIILMSSNIRWVLDQKNPKRHVSKKNCSSKSQNRGVIILFPLFCGLKTQVVFCITTRQKVERETETNDYFNPIQEVQNESMKCLDKPAAYFSPISLLPSLLLLLPPSIDQELKQEELTWGRAWILGLATKGSMQCGSHISVFLALSRLISHNPDAIPTYNSPTLSGP
jgi:hypothetical protein